MTILFVQPHSSRIFAHLRLKINTEKVGTEDIFEKFHDATLHSANMMTIKNHKGVSKKLRIGQNEKMDLVETSRGFDLHIEIEDVAEKFKKVCQAWAKPTILS